jgi:O-antigen/teichoic acid export membrane protein
MGNSPQWKSEAALEISAGANGILQANAWLRSRVTGLPALSRWVTVVYSFADQGLAVGATFLANVMLARAETKEQFGMFALSYSVYTFLAGLHNSVVLEPCTVYGSGRYRDRFSQYLRLMVRVNAIVGLLLMMVLLLVCLVLRWVAPQYLSGALWGLAVTIGVLVTGSFLRRVFYLKREAKFAVQASLASFVTVACGLWLATKMQWLNGFTVFLILALGWAVACLALGKKFAPAGSAEPFLSSEPGYWAEHWKYSKWVLSTAFVFQLTTQGYYWLAAGFVSVKQVAELRVMYLLIAPVDQIFIALSYLVVPALAARYATGLREEYISLSRHYALLILATTALFALAVRLVGRPVMHWLYAGKFDDVAPLLYVLAFSPVLMAVGNAASCALNAVEKPRLVFFAYVSSGVATLLGGIPLVIHYGLRGAVYGMLFSAATYSATLAAGFQFSMHGKIAK